MEISGRGDWAARVVSRLIELEQPGSEAYRKERDALAVQFYHIVTGVPVSRAVRRRDIEKLKKLIT